MFWTTLPTGISSLIRSLPRPHVTALHLELSTLVQTLRASFLVSQVSQLRAHTASHWYPCTSACYACDCLWQKAFACAPSKPDLTDGEPAAGRKWNNQTSLARCHVPPMKSCCKVNKAQPAQSAHCHKLKEHFQTLHKKKKALCKKPRGQSDTEIIKLIILKVIINSRTDPSLNSLVNAHHVDILVFSLGTPEVR